MNDFRHFFSVFLSLSVVLFFLYRMEDRKKYTNEKNTHNGHEFFSLFLK